MKSPLRLRWGLAEQIGLSLSLAIALGALTISVLVPRSITVEFEQFVEATRAVEPPAKAEGALQEVVNAFASSGRGALKDSPAQPFPGFRLLALLDNGDTYLSGDPVVVTAAYGADYRRLEIHLGGERDDRVVLEGVAGVTLTGPTATGRAWLVPESIFAPPASFEDRVRYRTYWIIIPIVIVVLALCYVIVRRSTQRVRQLNDAMQRIDDGPLPEPIEVTTEDEIGELTRCFNDTLRRLDRMRSGRRRMTSDLAHELRTPLTNVRARIEGILEGVFEPSEDELRLVLGELGLLTTLVDDLQQLALAEADELRLRLEEVDLTRLLCDVANAWQGPALDCGAILERDIATDLAAELDPARLRQLLGILIDNALRHGGRNVTVRLSARRADGRLKIEVTDDGPGIKPIDQEQVFERLYRADASRDRRTGGTGLGLAIARQLARILQADLKLVPSVRGARFCITFHNSEL